MGLMADLSVRDHPRIQGAATAVERRRKLRIDVDATALLRGVDVRGERFEQSVRVCSLSASGLYMRAVETVEKLQLGATLFIMVRFAAWERPGLTLAVHATVRRLEMSTSGYGVAVAFRRYRLL
jgi:hypothetical protein